VELDIRSLLFVPAAVLLVDANLKPLSGSRKGFSVFGVRAQPDALTDSIRQLDQALLAESDFFSRMEAAKARVRRPGSEAQFRWERSNRVYEVEVGAVGYGEALGYFVLFTDVTQQIRFEQTRELTRRYLEDILNNIQLGVVVMNREMRITNMNRAQEGFLHRIGTSISWVEAIGMEVSELWPEDDARRWEEIREQVLGKGEAYEDPQRSHATPEGDLILSVEITPLRDQRGDLIGAIQVSEDVTERVQLEEDLRRAEIVAERLEAVRETAITVNHEVNNPLTTILATAQMLLLSEKELSDSLQERLRQVEVNAKRIAEVTKRLRMVEEVKTKEYIASGPKMLDLGLEE
jgi:PAS domain S-box-containing protein